MRQDILELAQRAARLVGSQILSHYKDESDLDVRFKKGPSDVVTQVDIWAEHEISRLVKKAFPEHLIIGEEQFSTLSQKEQSSLEQQASEGVNWIVDPIDGTANFVNRIPHSSVSLGILEYGIRQVGVVFDPYRNEMFTALKDSGACLNDAPIRVSATESLSHAVIVSAFDDSSGKLSPAESRANQVFLKEARAYRRFGSAAIDLCWVAAGRLDAAFEPGLAAWDAAAGSLIVEEAGGVVCNFGRSSSNELDLFSKLFFAANPRLHSEMLGYMSVEES